jgi:hypothetical protein
MYMLFSPICCGHCLEKVHLRMQTKNVHWNVHRNGHRNVHGNIHRNVHQYWNKHLISLANLAITCMLNGEWLIPSANVATDQSRLHRRNHCRPFSAAKGGIPSVEHPKDSSRLLHAADVAQPSATSATVNEWVSEWAGFYILAMLKCEH